MVNTVKNVLIIPNNPLQLHLKLSQKEHFQKQQKQLVILLAIKFLTELQMANILPQNNSETVANEHDKNIPIYIYIYTNIPVNVIIKLPHPRSGDSQGQET